MFAHKNTRRAYLNCFLINDVSHIHEPFLNACQYFFQIIIIPAISAIPSQLIHHSAKFLVVSVCPVQKKIVKIKTAYDLKNSNKLLDIVSWNDIKMEAKTCKKLIQIKYQQSVLIIPAASGDLKWLIASRSAPKYIRQAIPIPIVT